MNPFLKNGLRFLFFACIGAGLIYLIVRNITPDDWKNIKLAAVNANYFWVIISLATGIFSHVIRAIRWRMLIESIDKKPGLINTFSSVMIGYMANYALPRLGEISRCGVLARYEKTSFAELIGTVIIERVIDFFMLFLFFLAMLVLSFNKVFSIIKVKSEIVFEDKIFALKHLNLTMVLGVLIILFVLIWLIYRMKDNLLKFANKFALQFLEGIKSIGKLRQPILFWFYSLIIWFLYLLALYFCFFSFNETSHLSLNDALVVLSFSTFGVIATPGGIGAYQLIVISVLTHIYLISQTTSFTLAWIIWGTQLILIVILGLISLLLLPVFNKNEKT